MKTFIFAVLLSVAFSVYPAPTIKKACHVVNAKQVCKWVKIHKKYIGHTVPQK